MANMNEAVYNSKKALPNKLLQEDGTITTMSGRAVINSTDAYDSKSSLPNKFLNPDGTYSTLNQIIAESVDTDLFIVVDELPQTGEPNKIYLLVQSNRMIEYIWVNNAWDPVGMVEFDINNYYTKSEITDLLAGTLNAAKSYANTNFLKKDNTTAFTPTADYHPATKKYVDDKVGIPCIRLTENTDLRTSTLLPTGDYYLIKGSYTLTYTYSDMGNNPHTYTFTNIPSDGCLFHVGSKNDFSIDELVASWEDPDTRTEYAVIKDGRGEPTLYSSTMVDIENEQTITGLKHFSTLPQSTVTPTTNYQLVNKKYVDDSAATLLKQSNIAPAYDATQTYNEGDYVMYNGNLYECNTDITVAEA